MKQRTGFLNRVSGKIGIGFFLVSLCFLAVIGLSLANVEDPVWSRVAAGIGLLISLAFGAFLVRDTAVSLGHLEDALDLLSQDDRLESSGILQDLTQRHDDVGSLAVKLSQVVDQMKEKVVWYEAILDSIPFPLSVTDINMNWTFINRPVESLLKLNRKDILGKHCSNWKANICNTEQCGILGLRRNRLQTTFDQAGGNYQVDSSFLHNSHGEKIGHVEVVQDVTRLVASSRYSDQAVNQIAGYLNQMAQGVLQFEMTALPSGNKHTAEVEKNFQMINQTLSQARDMLSQTIQVAIRNADAVDDASDQLAGSANQTSEATAQIAATIAQVATGTSQQNESITRASDMLNEVTQMIHKVADGANAQAEAVSKAAEVTAKIAAKDGISDKVGLSATKVQEMGQRSEQIGAIVETIEDIASQTNLLALNAAIEAARAGEHGKGFAVVADEVRKLAERSSASTKEISALITVIQKTVADAVKMSTEASSLINTVSTELSQSIILVSTVVGQTVENSQKLLESSNLVIEAMENIASISEENGAAVEEVSASTEEMNAQVEEVSASAQSLAGLAAELKQVVSRFNVNGSMQPILGAPAKKVKALGRGY